MYEFITFTSEILDKENLNTIRAIGRRMGVRAPASLNKNVLIEEIIKIQRGDVIPEKRSNAGAPVKGDPDLSRFYRKEDDYYKSEPVQKPIMRDSNADCFIVEGYFEYTSQSYGFIRIKLGENTNSDVFVSLQNIRKFNLRKGDKVKAIAKVVREGENAALQNVVSVNDLDARAFLTRKDFDSLTPYYPTERIKMEIEGEDDQISNRIIDLFCPIGKGQRGLIVAPPKTGKTTLLKTIASSIEKNNPEVKLIVLLIDERPEEVTDIKRSINSEVVYSTFDESANHHVLTAEAVITRAKNLVEAGVDVVILMDSITRLARAYNSVIESSGKILSGGLDPLAMQGPKRIFGAARNIEDGGSLTILSTALVDTGSRMDDVIFEEFKGTGNMEIHLSRELSEKRVFPAIDLFKSGTRKEELLLNKKQLETSNKLRKFLSSEVDATEKLIEMLGKTKDNKDLEEKLDAWIKICKK